MHAAGVRAVVPPFEMRLFARLVLFLEALFFAFLELLFVAIIFFDSLMWVSIWGAAVVVKLAARSSQSVGGARAKGKFEPAKLWPETPWMSSLTIRLNHYIVNNLLKDAQHFVEWGF